MLVLAVQIDQDAGQLAERRAGGERAVDEGAAAALRRDLAPQDHFPAVRRVEDGLDRRRVLPGPDEVGRGAAADQQPDGADEDGLAGAGLAGQDVQAGLELELEAVDDGQIADGEEAEHETAKCHLIRCLTAQNRGVLLFREPALSQRRVTICSGGLFAHACLRPCAVAQAAQPEAGAGELTTNTDIVRLVADASPLAKVVLLILLIFSAVSWGIILYKFWTFRRAERQTATFLGVFRKSSKFSEVQAVCPTLSASPLVGLFQSGYAELNAQLRGRRSPSRQSQRRPPDVQH